MNKIFFTLIIAAFCVVSAKAQMPAIGTKATELNYKNPEGKEISLASLQGNIVLLDFWASWCGPCRRNNPGVVALYSNYLNKKWVKGVKGFTVYSVSLDQSGEAWKQAIKQDGLVWENHVSDLRGWSSDAAAKYGIRSIPQTVLIDETGYVIAINPPQELITQLLNKKLNIGAAAAKTKSTKSKSTTTKSKSSK